MVDRLSPGLLGFLELIVFGPFWMAIDTFNDGWWVLFAISLVLCGIYVILGLMLIYGVFYLIDTVGVKGWKDEARVVSKHYTPAHTQMIMQQVGKVMVPQMIYIPASWSADVSAHGTVMSCGISRAQYYQLRSNQRVRVTLVRGRVSRSLYCMDIRV